MADITIIEIAVCAISTVLALLVQHYMLKYLLPQDVHRLLAYVLGVLAIIVPVTVVLMWHGEQRVAALIWAPTLAGGLAVMGAYALDDAIETRRNLRDAREREAWSGKNDAAARE